MREWTRYYEATGAEPRHTLLDALARFDEPGVAVDLGCGTGRDTFELLRRGWRVVATHEFEAVWARVVDSLAAGGRFCGQLFGERDEWAPDDQMSFQTRQQAEALFSEYDLERFDEVEEDSTTATGEAKHWHLFHVVARKR